MKFASEYNRSKNRPGEFRIHFWRPSKEAEYLTQRGVEFHDRNHSTLYSLFLMVAEWKESLLRCTAYAKPTTLGFLYVGYRMSRNFYETLLGWGGIDSRTCLFLRIIGTEVTSYSRSLILTEVTSYSRSLILAEVVTQNTESRAGHQHQASITRSTHLPSSVFLHNPLSRWRQLRSY